MPKPVNTGPQWLGPDLAIKPGMHPLVAKAILYRLGFERLGTGAVCTAFRLGQSDRVVKLVCDRAGHRGALQLFEDNPQIEAFPTIFGSVELTNDCFIYETEWLDVADSFDEYGYGDDFTGYRDEVYWEDVAEHFGWDAADALADLTAEDSFEVDPDGAYYFDLHDENYRQRADGTPVIVDPFHLHVARCEEGRSIVSSGRRTLSDPNYDHWTRPDWNPDAAYWANVANTVPYRGATTTALVPLTQI